jgi:hypothetical protein
MPEFKRFIISDEGNKIPYEQKDENEVHASIFNWHSSDFHHFEEIIRRQVKADDVVEVTAMSKDHLQGISKTGQKFNITFQP